MTFLQIMNWKMLLKNQQETVLLQQIYYITEKVSNQDVLSYPTNCQWPQCPIHYCQYKVCPIWTQIWNYKVFTKTLIWNAFEDQNDQLDTFNDLLLSPIIENVPLKRVKLSSTLAPSMKDLHISALRKQKD